MAVHQTLITKPLNTKTQDTITPDTKAPPALSPGKGTIQPSKKMEWEATDNFGNLLVATSNATDDDSLQEHLASLVAESINRTPQNAIFTIDLAYAEVNAPHPGQVTHILTIPWLKDRLATGESKTDLHAHLATLIQDLLTDYPEAQATVAPL